MKTKIVKALSFMPFIFATHAFADIQVLGGESDISQSIAAHYQQETPLYNENFSQADALYINVGMASEDDIAIAKSHVVNGDTVIIDLRGIASDNQKMQQSQKIAGLGVSSPLLVTGTYQDEIIINSIVSDVTDGNGNAVSNPAAELKSLTQSLQFSLNRLNFGDK